MTIDFPLILSSLALGVAVFALALAMIGPKAARTLRNDLDDAVFNIDALGQRMSHRAKLENVTKARAVREQKQDSQLSIEEEAQRIVAQATNQTNKAPGPTPEDERRRLRARFLVEGNPRLRM